MAVLERADRRPAVPARRAARRRADTPGDRRPRTPGLPRPPGQAAPQLRRARHGDRDAGAGRRLPRLVRRLAPGPMRWPTQLATEWAVVRWNPTDGGRLVVVLDEAECRRLLARAVIGRLAYTEGALPAIQPVHFTVHDGQVVIPTRVGSKVAAASMGAVVAFEVDEYDAASRTGWNVTVVGPSAVVTAPPAWPRSTSSAPRRGRPPTCPATSPSTRPSCEVDGSSRCRRSLPCRPRWVSAGRSRPSRTPSVQRHGPAQAGAGRLGRRDGQRAAALLRSPAQIGQRRCGGDRPPSRPRRR